MKTDEYKGVVKSLEEAGITKEGIRKLNDAVQIELDSVECDRVSIKENVIRVLREFMVIPDEVLKSAENKLNAI